MENLKTLKIYQDRCFINSLLFEKMMNHNIFVRNVLNFPLILISAILTVLNSIMDEKDMKIINIILNGTVGLILSMMNNFKINDKIATFKNEKAKIIKLQHKIDTYLNSKTIVEQSDLEEKYSLAQDVMDKIPEESKAMFDDLSIKIDKLEARKKDQWFVREVNRQKRLDDYNRIRTTISDIKSDTDNMGVAIKNAMTITDKSNQTDYIRQYSQKLNSLEDQLKNAKVNEIDV